MFLAFCVVSFSLLFAFSTSVDSCGGDETCSQTFVG